jgi:hypothetical protein
MKLQPAKAAGAFFLRSYASLELIIHIEADPLALSFGAFNFHSVLPPHKAEILADMPAFALRHETGNFVIAVQPHDFTETRLLRECWAEADRFLARRNIWLFLTSSDALQAEPRWSNALQIARCAHIDVDRVDKSRVVEFLDRVGQASFIECARRCEACHDSRDAVLKLISDGTLHHDAAPLASTSPIRLQPFTRPHTIPWLINSNR